MLFLDMMVETLDLFLGILIHEGNRRLLTFNEVRGGGVGIAGV